MITCCPDEIAAPERSPVRASIERPNRDLSPHREKVVAVGYHHFPVLTTVVLFSSISKRAPAAVHVRMGAPGGIVVG